MYFSIALNMLIYLVGLSVVRAMPLVRRNSLNTSSIPWVTIVIGLVSGISVLILGYIGFRVYRRHKQPVSLLSYP